jgi:hypothetical protein
LLMHTTIFFDASIVHKQENFHLIFLFLWRLLVCSTSFRILNFMLLILYSFDDGFNRDLLNSKFQKLFLKY